MGCDFTIDQDKIYFTMTRTHQIFIYTLEKGIEIKRYGTIKASNKDGEFHDPQGLTINKDSLYVCDNLNHRIQVLDKENGKFLYQWGKHGKEKEGEFISPNCILFYQDFLYIGDQYRVQLFDSKGVFITKVGDEPCSMCLVDERLYIVDIYSRMQVFT